MSLENQEGCLFILNGKKFIYTGFEQKLNGKKNHTFYGLDGIDSTSNQNDLTGLSFNDAINQTRLDANAAVLDIINSPVYSEYKKGIPKLSIPGFTGPKSFYEIPGENATPKKFNIISNKENLLPSENYVYRVGTNGPSIKYIQNGKIVDINNFIEDYKKMKLKYQIPTSVPLTDELPLTGELPTDEEPLTSGPPTSGPPTSGPPTNKLPTSGPSINELPTSVPPINELPTSGPSTDKLPTDEELTGIPLTDKELTGEVPTSVLQIDEPSTIVPQTSGLQTNESDKPITSELSEKILS